MSSFKPVEITHNGEVKTIPANKVLRLIAKVEQNFNLADIQACKFYSAATVALCYAPVLEHAGFEVDEDQLAMDLTKSPERIIEIVVWAIELMKLLKAPEDVETDADAGAPMTDEELKKLKAD
jgi:hypothetical protein